MVNMDGYEENASIISTERRNILGTFDPIEVGLGSFFSYAASFWTFHFLNADDGVCPAELIELCGAGTQRLSNWVEQWQRPSCTLVIERSLEDKLDPLVATAMFGTTNALARMIKCDIQGTAFLPGSPGIAFRVLVKGRRMNTTKHLCNNGVLIAALCCTIVLWG